MRDLDLTNVEEATEYPRLKAGGYVAKIVRVDDVSDKEYLKIYYDIAEGEFKDYFKDLANKFNNWNGTFIRSYKEKALPFFKGFITAVEQSNRAYKFDNDESKLVGNGVGIVLSEEEYESKTGEVKIRLVVSKLTSVEKIKKGDYEVPKIKELEYKTDDSSDDDFPWK